MWQDGGGVFGGKAIGHRPQATDHRRKAKDGTEYASFPAMAYSLQPAAYGLAPRSEIISDRTKKVEKLIMNTELTCIECPKGCRITVCHENGVISNISGFSCAKGEKYARAEIECPERILTSCVLAEGLFVRMIPVRTDKPIPKNKLIEAMAKIKKLKIKHPVHAGDIVKKDFIIPGVNLFVTRAVYYDSSQH